MGKKKGEMGKKSKEKARRKEKEGEDKREKRVWGEKGKN